MVNSCGEKTCRAVRDTLWREARFLTVRHPLWSRLCMWRRRRWSWRPWSTRIWRWPGGRCSSEKEGAVRSTAQLHERPSVTTILRLWQASRWKPISPSQINWSRLRIKAVWNACAVSAVMVMCGDRPTFSSRSWCNEGCPTRKKKMTAELSIKEGKKKKMTFKQLQKDDYFSLSGVGGKIKGYLVETPTRLLWWCSSALCTEWWMIQVERYGTI